MLKSPIALLMCVIATASAAAGDELTDSDKRIIREAVAETLKDPDSAKFKDDIWRAIGDTSLTNGGRQYCGMVNARNSMGGYSGFVYFVVGFTPESEANSASVTGSFIYGTRYHPLARDKYCKPL
jgi:hypothetical protein